MRNTLRVIAVAAIAATAMSVSGTPTAAAPSANGTAHRASRVCATATAGTAACHAYVRTDLAPAATPSGYGPTDLRSAYKLTTSGSASQTVAIVDAYDAPDGRGGPGRVPHAVRPARVHHRQRLLPQGRPERRHQLPAQEHRLGPGDLPGPRHGLGDLPELPHPAGRGEDELIREPRHGGEPGGHHGRHRDQQQLGWLGRVRRHLRFVLQPPRHRHHSQLRRQRLRRGVPGIVAVRHRGRRHPPRPPVAALAAGPRPSGPEPAPAARR